MDAPEAEYPCPCCGHVTLGAPPGSYEICDVCFWEDDAVQLRWTDWGGGANGPSLIDAQRNYVELGAVEERFTRAVRTALVDEAVDGGWRVIDTAIDSFEPAGIQHAPWPDDRTALYWWRPIYWRRD